ncbi:hypothetical protein F5Y03DRAFT_371717 [Xylaria venustula]|nr:hypothetical protein F5Y03DRAFT_371717 [Xylaria venustula]
MQPSLFSFPWLFSQAASSLNLNITAVTASNGSSILECWQLDQPFTTSTEPGISGTALLSLGDVSSLSYTMLPPHFDGGVHNAPRNQWVVFLSGLAYVSLPGDETSGVYIAGGEFGLIFAADTEDVSATGHRTQYPGTTETTALQIPTVDGKLPAHSVLHPGPCGPSDISGIRGYGAST